MNYKKLLSAFMVSANFLFGCSDSSGNGGSKDVSSSVSESATSSSGNARFSCTIDGQAVSGGAIDAMQEFNTAFIVDVDQGKELLFYLRDIKNGGSGNDYTFSLRFAVPDKTGNISYGPEEDGWGIEVDIKKTGGGEATYFSDSFTIDVTTLSSTRTAGTFSGKFKLREGATSQDSKKEIEVTDGKFDIPFSTGNMRPT